MKRSERFALGRDMAAARVAIREVEEAVAANNVVLLRGALVRLRNCAQTGLWDVRDYLGRSTGSNTIRVSTTNRRHA